jgi:hypothetical protein
LSINSKPPLTFTVRTAFVYRLTQTIKKSFIIEFRSITGGENYEEISAIFAAFAHAVACGNEL